MKGPRHALRRFNVYFQLTASAAPAVLLLWILLAVFSCQATLTSAADAESRTAAKWYLNAKLDAVCAAQAFTKQSCLFKNVCLKPGAEGQILIILPGPSSQADRDLLYMHLKRTLAGVYHHVNIIPDKDSVPHTATWDVHAVTVLWHAHKYNHASFGHAMINFAFPIFQVLENHFTGDIPSKLQLLVHSWRSPVLQHVLKGTIASRTLLLRDRLAELQADNADTLCFANLLLGDGGYVAASRASLSNSGKYEATAFSTSPSFFSSAAWWSFRQHAMLVSGVLQAPAQARPFILLNDKRYGPDAAGDRRMIRNISELAVSIQQAYPEADVFAARFRDLPFVKQLDLLSRARVFVTTQGSSAFRLVFLPKGSTCIVIGSPEGPYTEWRSFHELDKWFPLTYVRFERYQVAYKDQDEYEVLRMSHRWHPADPTAAENWWLYNANVNVRLDRLQPMINRALSSQ